MTTDDREEMREIYLGFIQEHYDFMFEETLIKLKWERVADYQGGTV